MKTTFPTVPGGTWVTDAGTRVLVLTDARAAIHPNRLSWEGSLGDDAIVMTRVYVHEVEALLAEAGVVDARVRVEFDLDDMVAALVGEFPEWYPRGRQHLADKYKH